MPVFNLKEFFVKFTDQELRIRGRIIATGKKQVEKFLENPFPHRHIILFYEEPEDVKILQYTFLKHSLQSNGSCCYVTHDGYTTQKIIEDEMKYFGINVDEAKKNNRLHVEILPNLEKFNGDIVELIKERIIPNLTKLPAPRRLVGIQGIPVCTEKKIESAFKKERFIRNKLVDLQTQQICPVCLKDIEPSKLGSWIIRYLCYHDCAIFSSGPDKIIVFELISSLQQIQISN